MNAIYSQANDTQAGLSVADVTLREIYDHSDASQDNASDVQVQNLEENDSSSDRGSSGSLHSSGGEGSIIISPTSTSDISSTGDSSSDSDTVSNNQEGEGEGEEEHHGNDGSDNGEGNDSSGDEECLNYVR